MYLNVCSLSVTDIISKIPTFGKRLHPKIYYLVMPKCRPTNILKKKPFLEIIRKYFNFLIPQGRTEKRVNSLATGYVFYTK